MRASHLARAAANSLFVSAKTSTAIPTSSDLVRDSLVQASLDPSVRRIDFHAQARVHAQQVDLNAIGIVRDDGHFYLDIVEARTTRDDERDWWVALALAVRGMTALTLTADEIRRQPRFANANLVWSYRMHPVGISTRMAVLEILRRRADDTGTLAVCRPRRP